ncbi:MAG TPA: acyl-phosphate--glycerol-3-phosphate O-acyltransferase, partial [Armatimonadetes bacterium]|nr:acyl-phosphate--glycerol-3-phosphate O-acyltransferase [Armatimonadota bacterium]
RVALLAFLLWGLVVKVTRYVSVGSMVGGVAVPCLLAAFRDPWEYVAFGVVGAAFILWRHRPNLQRLRAGTEPQIGQRVEVPKMSEEEVKTEPPP